MNDCGNVITKESALSDILDPPRKCNINKLIIKKCNIFITNLIQMNNCRLHYQYILGYISATYFCERT